MRVLSPIRGPVPMKTKSASTGLPKQKWTRGIVKTVKIVVYAVLIYVVIYRVERTVAYEPFNIRSAAMMPTLLVGDIFFVSKFSYGYSRYSFPFGLPLFSGRIFFHPPDRGDVVVFRSPIDNSTDWIKRLIGLPGDHIQMKNGILYINDQPCPRRRIEDYLYRDGSGAITPLPQYVETLPNGRQHPIIKIGDNGPLDNTPVYDIPPGDYFMLGDNRDNSRDSRVLSAVGYVPAENLIGRAEFIFLSIDGSAIRSSRLFRGVN
jgi:signal peptidase I